MWCKLQAVDKNTRHRHVAQWLGLFDQRNMAIVQVAHRGYKSGALEVFEFFAQFGNGVNNVHRAPWVAFVKRLRQGLANSG
jgi:hypothetical protein